MKNLIICVKNHDDVKHTNVKILKLIYSKDDGNQKNEIEIYVNGRQIICLNH